MRRVLFPVQLLAAVIVYGTFLVVVGLTWGLVAGYELTTDS
jgi:hypothetical protein